MFPTQILTTGGVTISPTPPTPRVTLVSLVVASICSFGTTLSLDHSMCLWETTSAVMRALQEGKLLRNSDKVREKPVFPLGYTTQFPNWLPGSQGPPPPSPGTGLGMVWARVGGLVTELPVSLEHGRDKIYYCQDHRAGPSFNHNELSPRSFSFLMQAGSWQGVLSC